MRKYCRQQAITRPRLPVLKNEPLWYPYTPKRVALVGKILRALVARDVRRRISSTPRG
jgi:betaine-aldehyde dehydrogenase